MKDYNESEEEVKVLTVKDLDPDDRPREKALKHGCQVLTTPDLWAIILRTGLVGKPITELCRDLMRECDGKLCNLERLTRQQILKVKGLGTAKVLQIEAVMELIRRYSRETIGTRYRIRSSKDIYTLMRPEIGNLPHEEIWALFLNRGNEVIHKMRMTQGSAVASVFDVKAILKEALLRDAQGLVMCHNHPSGNLTASVQDDNITMKMKNGAQAMDIRFLDHVIVTSENYYSYCDTGRL
ncbi:MAG: DNA repair protein RadC [Bacteroides sp.]|nr:DNA repair protein RadC [Bacteroidales bacterium]MBD5303609.1 DNA repair protein RadC [Bacteroides sp.]